MSTTQTVIARYGEDIQWAESRPDALVYNKGKELVTPLPVKNLPNIGRESHTYLHHIVENWDHLADVTLFTQGHIHDHFPPGVTFEQFFDPNVDIVVPRIVRCQEWDEAGRLVLWGPCKERYDSGRMHPAELPMVDWFRTFIEIDPIEHGGLVYTPGAIFTVKRECIQRRTKAFYKRLLLTVSRHVDPEEAYFIERAWLYMFAIPEANIRFLGT